MKKPSEDRPDYPFVVMNRHYVWKPSGRIRFSTITERAFLNGRFKEKVIALDVHCRRFELLDVVNLGKSWLDVLMLSRQKCLKVCYVFGPPVQLTFDEARAEYVEHCCSRGWWSASYENEAQFRARNAKYSSMRELLEPVHYAGKWVL